MKNYSKEYEDYYSKPKHIDKLNLQTIEVDGMGVQEYVDIMKSVFLEGQANLFDFIVKIVWLIEKCKINGERKQMFGQNSIPTNYYYSTLLRNMVGRDLKMFTTPTFFREVSSYFSIWFPDFHLSNPFKIKYEYPYEHVNFDHLVFVSSMEEKKEMIEYAEKEKIPLLTFYDYVINYIHCLNDELGYDKYYLRKATLQSQHDKIIKIKYEET